MKINRIKASAFAISGELERSFIERTQGKSGGQSTVDRGYMPLLACYAVGEARNKGYSNKFFLSLTTGDTCLLRQKTYSDSIKNMIFKHEKEPEVPEIERNGLLAKIKNLPAVLIGEFGELVEAGTTRMVGIDPQKTAALRQLAGLNLAEVYTHQVTEYVKPLFKLPPFTSPVFDLSAQFEVVSVVEDEYPRERLVYTPQQLCYLLDVFYGCSAMIEGIVYLPYLKSTVSSRGHSESEFAITAMPKVMRSTLRKYEHPKELRPLMVGIKGEGMSATPLESAAIDFSGVSGMDNVKEEIKQGIIYPLKNPQLSKEFGQKAGGGILLYGPPGCGKTFIVRATVGEAGVNFYTVNIQDVIGEDPNIGAKKLHDAFEEARLDSPSILFFDEIDALSGVREAGQSSFEHMLINQFLTEMDGIGSVNENVLVIGATNMPWGVDPAIRRSGRFTTKIYIPPPDALARKALFKSSLKGKPTEGIDLDRLAELTEGYSSADISAICDEASKIPWGESLKGMARRPIRMDDFVMVLDNHMSSLIPWFNQAGKEIEASGEKELFKGLAEYLEKHHKVALDAPLPAPAAAQHGIPGVKPQSPVAPVNPAIPTDEQSLVRNEISILQKKHASGEIGDEIFKEMLKDYERRLIELEARSV
ncbi:MAG: ATP-binding protein [Candidatus Altiarchaeota archaeon]|nr:ATP-binding protein [Candidatus Altiarchaeota archaeon]